MNYGSTCDSVPLDALFDLSVRSHNVSIVKSGSRRTAQTIVISIVPCRSRFGFRAIGDVLHVRHTSEPRFSGVTAWCSARSRGSSFDKSNAASYKQEMCLICIEFDKSAMRVAEARRALGEMRGGLEPAHIAKVEAKLDEAEREERARQAAAKTP